MRRHVASCLFTLLLSTACADEEGIPTDTTSPGGSAGVAGAAGSAQGGAGQSGSSGSSGQGGAGAAGQGGSSGQGGAAGAAGQGGVAGQGGASGQGGTAGAAGTGAGGVPGEFRRTGVHQGYGEAWGLVAHDLDGDGDDELVLAGRNVAVMADAGLTANAPRWAHDWAPGGYPTENGDNDWAYGVAVHDVDGDGKPDVTALTSQRRLVALGGADGAPLFDVALQGKGLAVSLVTFDGDQDGVPDLLINGEGAAYSGRTGEPLFTVEQPHLHVFSSRAELDGDERDELLLGLERPSIVGPGGGGPVGPPETLYATDHAGQVLWKTDVGGNVRALTRADLDGDGRDESAVLTGDAAVLVGPDGAVLSTLTFPDNELPTAVALARVEGETQVLVAVWNYDTSAPALVSRRPGGAEVFRVELTAAPGPVKAVQVPASWPGGASPVAVVAAGQSSPAGGEVTVVDLAAGAAERVQWAASVGFDPDTMTLTSWQGEPALAVGGRSARVELLAPATGKLRAEWLAGSFQVASAAGDLDGDGIDEIASVDDRATVRVVDASGKQLFARRLSVGVAGAGSSVQIADVDGDGKPEVVAAASAFPPAKAPGVIDVLDPQGEVVRSILTSGIPDAVRVADLDGDGTPEIVAGESAAPAAQSCLVRAYGPDGNALWTTPIGSCFSTLIEVGDVDGQPGLEVAYGDTVIVGDPHVALLGPDGAVRWSLIVPELTQWIGIDDQKRLLFGGAASDFRGKLTLRQAADGAPAWETYFDGRKEADGFDIPGSVTSAAFVPDQDADGLADLATTHATGEVRLVSGKGTVLWTRPLEPTGLSAAERHTARGALWVPGTSAPAYLVVAQGSETRMRSSVFALDLTGAITAEVATTGEARHRPLLVRTPEGPRAAVSMSLDVAVFGR